MSQPAPLAGGSALLLVMALAACDSRPEPQLVVDARRCAAIDAARPFDTELTAPSAGLLVLAVEQSGISSTVTIGSGKDSLSAESPIERYGLITLSRKLHTDDRVSVRVQSRDSPDIVGDVCVSASLIDERSTNVARPERAYAAAGIAVRKREWNTAFASYADAARDFDRFAPARAAAARHAMGELAYRQFKRYREAVALADQTSRDFGPQSDSGLRSAIAALKAKAVLGAGSRDANALRERVLALLQRSEDLANGARFGKREIPRLQIMRGFMEYVADRPAASVAHFEHASAQCEAMHDWECFARAQQNLGAMAEETQGYAVALKAYEEALHRLDSRIAPELAADIQGNLGRLQSTAGLVTASIDSLATAMRLYAGIHDCDGARRSLVRLGRLLAQVGSIEDALEYLERGASLDCPTLFTRIERDVQAVQADADVLDSVAEADLRLRRRNPQALTRALCATPRDPASLSEDGKFAVFLALLSLNETLLMERENESANQCLMQAQRYATSTRDRLRLANAQGVTQLRRGEVGDADKSFVRALEIVDKGGLSSTQLFASRAYLGIAEAALLEGNTERTLTFARRGLETSAARGEVSQMVAALQLIAGTMRQSKDQADAPRALEVAVRLIEQVPIDELDGEKRATYLATQHAVFSELTEILVADTQAKDAGWEAFSASERGRARSLRFATTQAEHATLEGAAVETSARYKELVRRLTDPALQQSPEGELADYIRKLATLVEDSPTSAPAIEPARFVKQLARLDASFVEYAVGKTSMFAFVVNDGQLHVVRLGDSRKISAAAEELLERVRDEESAVADVQQSARALAELILWPLREHLTRPRLVIVPDDSLHVVPFATLPWSAESGAELLVQRIEPVVVPSASFLDHPPLRVQGSARTLALFGDPIFQERDWRRKCLHAADTSEPLADGGRRSMPGWVDRLPRLPATRDEVLSIAQVARGADPRVGIDTRLDCTATRTALHESIRASPEILHIATHGYVDASRPRLSALALTREAAHADDRSVFTLRDILDTKLSSRLVVLSACETSSGRLLPGEGVLGPAQAFLQSGAASVLASHWRVADEETAAFMRSFYRNLLAARMPAAAALRRAQLDRIASGKTYHWAAFSLYGWPDISFGEEKNQLR